MSPSTPSSCPPPEILAAFVDGRLAGEERRAVVAHLARCADCREIVAESAAFLAEEERRSAPATQVERFSVRKVIYIGAGLAAAVALVAVLLPRPGSDGDAAAAALSRPAAELLRTFEGGDLPRAIEHLETGQPGLLAFSGGTTPRRRALLLGAGVVDLTVAVRADEMDAARRAVATLTSQVEAIEGGEAVREALGELSKDLGATGTPASLERRTARMAGIARIEGLLAGNVDRDRFQLGRFLEAARLAAFAHNRRFFEAPETRAALDAAAAMDLPEPARRSLERARELLAGHPPAEPDYAELAATFTDLLLLS